MIPGYPKVWTLGHPAVQDIFLDPVLVQEKVDGSQISFRKNQDGVIEFQSKRAEVIPGAAGMFTAGVEAIREIADLLTPGVIYRGEYLAKPKHNALAYRRVPVRHIVLFDVWSDGETHLDVEADRLGMEVVPCFFHGQIESAIQLRDFLGRESMLGGCPIEGVVVKNYGRWCVQTGDPLFGKYVSEAYKETHRVSWKAANPQAKDVLTAILEAVCTPRRWEKAVERLRDAGQLASAPQDIGKLITVVQEDVEVECEAEIKDALWRWAWPQIRRRTTTGLPEWYKARLLENAFCPR